MKGLTERLAVEVSKRTGQVVYPSEMNQALNAIGINKDTLRYLDLLIHRDIKEIRKKMRSLRPKPASDGRPAQDPTVVREILNLKEEHLAFAQKTREALR